MYREKKDYGKVPEYLAKRITIQQEEKSRLAHEASEHEKNHQWKNQIERGIVPLPEDERIKILDGLQANWDKLNSDYQKLSLTVDTVPKIARYIILNPEK